MDNKYDVVIKAHYKDYHKLDLVVDSLKYLNPEPENILKMDIIQRILSLIIRLFSLRMIK